MKVLVTGHDGYIGAVMVKVLQSAGHDVVGLDTHFFRGCTFGDEPAAVPALPKSPTGKVLRQLVASAPAVSC